MQTKIRNSFIILFSAIIAVLLFGCALMFTPKTTAHADTEETHDHSTMKELKGFAGIGIIGGEWYLGEDTNGDITIEEDSEVTICLNGHTLTGSGTGSVITVKEGAKLTLCDCVGTGIITGGTGYPINGSGIYCGGGIYVATLATFKLTGGTISNNTAYYGGGVFVVGGTFEMTGGTISGNAANWLGGKGGFGGGVLAINDAQFTMTGGAISNNTAYYRGGGVCICRLNIIGEILSGSTFLMTNGTISGNTADDGGGVYVSAGTLKLSGTPNITSNVDINNADNNVFLYDSDIISVTGTLNEGAQIGITDKIYNETVDFATGFMQSDKPSKYFISDNPDYNCIYVSGETGGTVTIGEQHDMVQKEAKEPTCTETGWEAYEGCSRCDYATDKFEIPALGHNYGEWTVVKEATQTEEGEERRVCENSNTHYETRTIPKLTPAAPAEEKSYLWILWLLIPLALGVGGVTLGVWVYKDDKKNNKL